MRAVKWRPSIGVLSIQVAFLAIPLVVQGQSTSENTDPDRAQKAQKLYEAGQRSYNSGDYAQGIEQYRQAFKANPDRPLTYYNSLAWCWATCPDEKQRDGRLAAKIGHYMCQVTNYDDPIYLDTYAAGLAEADDFKNAIKWQQKAVELARTSKTFPKRELPSSQLRLELYKQGRAYQEIPPDAAESKPQEQIVFKPEIKIEPKITLSASPPKKEVDVLIHSVTVYSTNAAGKAWDRSGPPDLKISIRNVDTGDSFTTPTKRDTESADFNCKAIRVSEGQKIEVSVLNADIFSDDTIGTYEKEITADTMKQGKVEWSFDRVSSLVLEFQP